ncbi:hypothetical protein, partial [Lysinibacillus xylanilyticus]|uniref:hypothetical protein n=1 Tax=Lysinibacillus xylanilyticus TaxID=582475 RepID=UPI00382DFB22
MIRKKWSELGKLPNTDHEINRFHLGVIVVAVATLSHRKHLLLPLRFRTENICCCRYAFAQKT